jgi:hypothetical protein
LPAQVIYEIVLSAVQHVTGKLPEPYQIQLKDVTDEMPNYHQGLIEATLAPCWAFQRESHRLVPGNGLVPR